MTTYSILLGEQPREYIQALDAKSQQIIKDNLRKLEENPSPGSGPGDKEKLVVDGEEMYRLHIGRTHTAFYIILDDEAEVRIVEITDIDDAHKRYGFDD
ncbi:MAG: type II toxin-antitoxin system RelE/ParE family toxin [Halobacteriales archaeon]